MRVIRVDSDPMAGTSLDLLDSFINKQVLLGRRLEQEFVGFVARFDIDIDVVAQNPALASIQHKPVQT